MTKSNLLENASLEELKRGYRETHEAYQCLCCGYLVEKGIIYPRDGVLYEAERYMNIHIGDAHGSVFEHLLHLDKSVTGLTEVQRNLLDQFYQGKSDAEVQHQLGIGSPSTVRNHRFVLKEKERQARVFLALMELLRSKDKQAPAVSEDPGGRTGDARSKAAASEKEKTLKKYFPDGPGGRLKSFGMKKKQRLIILAEIAKGFQPGRLYSEKEVNGVLEAAYDDYAVLRRYLVDYGFMDRKPDGSQYWLTDLEDREENEMNRKDELKQQAKEIKIQAGVFQIKNTVNQKVFIESTRNLKTINGQQFSLEMGSHVNKELQKEWNEFGKEAFSIDVLEVLKKKEGEYYDEKDALAKLKDKWMEKLQPYGDKGYHKQ